MIYYADFMITSNRMKYTNFMKIITIRNIMFPTNYDLE